MDVLKGINTCLENLHELVYSFEEMKEGNSIDINAIPDNLERLEQIRIFLEQADNTEKQDTQEKQEPEKENAVGANYLANSIVKTIYPDFKKAISLNDRFRFSRDLFGDKAEVFDKTLDELNSIQSLDEAINYLNQEFDWDWESESAVAFKNLLINRFA